MIRRMPRLLALLALLAFPAGAETISASSSDVEICGHLAITHRADADVAHQPDPGVDYEGEGLSIDIPEVMEVPITARLEQYLAGVPGGVMMEAPIQAIQIFSDGRVVYQGQDLTDRIQAYCEAKDRLKDDDVIKSAPGAAEQPPQDIRSDTDEHAAPEKRPDGQ